MTKRANTLKFLKFIKTFQLREISVEELFKNLNKKRHLFVPKVYGMYMHTIQVDHLYDADDDLYDPILAIKQHISDEGLSISVEARVYGPAETRLVNDMDQFVTQFFNAIPGIRMITYRRGPARYSGTDASPFESTIRTYDVYIHIDFNQWTGMRDYYAMKILGFAA